MIKSFGDALTESIFNGDDLTKKQRKAIGSLDSERAQRALHFLDLSTEHELLKKSSCHYHRLQGTNKYSIDAGSRKSPWRITFNWEDATMQNILLVRIEDTHK